ncbi:uncharacterized protein LOC134721070 [Mytilus trossulus]|uniref:uncharacterized protein LOC134721070 n=1 Tax=Mytilus trossulus TaxID=6551 RepID=UPI0030063722
MLSNRKLALQATHFSFGNDEACHRTTYTQDYTTQLSSYQQKSVSPPCPAEIIPPHRDIKWRSSNQQEYSVFPSINKDIYHRTLQDYNDIQVFSTRGDVWRNPEKLPPISRTTIDYGEPHIPCTNVTFDLLKKIQVHQRNARVYNNSIYLESEAMQAFQWPSPQRMRPVALFQFCNERHRARVS